VNENLRELGRLGAWSHLDRLDVVALRDFARRADELGFGTLWVPETVGRDPFVLLALLTDVTSSMMLGTSIANIYARDAQTMRTGAMSLQEASGGRFVLGLGVSHPHLVEKLRGHTYERPVTRMREYVTVYRSAIYKGPIAEGAGEPPVLLAALRERMTDLAATDADGAFPYLFTTNRVRWQRERLDAAASGSGRRPVLAVTMPTVVETDPAAARATARAYLTPYLRTPNYHASWTAQGFEPADWERPGSDRLVDAMVAWGDVEAIRARVAEFVDAGADHVAVIPLATDGSDDDLPTLEALAS
jgi:probable F420-dependent oxidoreductase